MYCDACDIALGRLDYDNHLFSAPHTAAAADKSFAAMDSDSDCDGGESGVPVGGAETAATAASTMGLGGPAGGVRVTGAAASTMELSFSFGNDSDLDFGLDSDDDSLGMGGGGGDDDDDERQASRGGEGHSEGCTAAPLPQPDPGVSGGGEGLPGGSFVEWLQGRDDSAHVDTAGGSAADGSSLFLASWQPAFFSASCQLAKGV